METVTRLLNEARHGEPDAASALFELVYDELVVLARRQRGRWVGDETLDTRALVHEAYLKLVDGATPVAASGRAHFFALAAKAMRHILTNYARDRQRLKRGGGRPHVAVQDLGTLADAADPALLAGGQADLLVALDEALAGLERVSPRQSRVVECRFYGQMSVPETAAALDLSPATVKRDWAVAQAWLHREVERLAT